MQSKPIEFAQIPYPPSHNAIYGINKSKWGRGKVKTKEYREWLDQMYLWGLLNKSLILEAKSILGAHILTNQEPFFLLDIRMVIPKTDIIGKKGQIKRLDATNRIKPLMDAMAEILNIDDRHFFLAGCQYVAASQGTRSPPFSPKTNPTCHTNTRWVDLTITPTILKTL